jgi:uncharacterized protein (DUF4415 family)
MRKDSIIKAYSAEDLRKMVAEGEDQTDFALIDAMSEADVERAIADDPDWQGVPRDWYRGAEAVMPRPKIAVSIRLDAELVEFFRSQGRGWQTRMNAVLRAYANAVQTTKAG